jgi:hypothetical protein
MIRTWANLARCYCDLLRFWRDCPDKTCRRARRCGDQAGKCWQKRYGASPRKARLRDRVRATRKHLPLGERHLPQLYDPSDAML